MATHSSILAREIPWTEEPSGLQSWCHKVGNQWVTEHVDMYSIMSQKYNHQGIFIGKNNYEMFV